MATLTLAPFGLKFVRNYQSNSPNYSANRFYIAASYASKIGFGDLVITASGGGAVQIYSAGGSGTLGVFMGCAPFFDTTLQAISNKQWYATTEAPADVVPCWVITDPFAVFTLQVGGSSGNNPVTRAMQGGTIDVAQNGSPNTSTGVSTAYADATSYVAAGTKALRIIGPSEMFFAGYDPSINTTFSSPPTNNYIDVRLNTQQDMTSTGI